MAASVEQAEGDEVGRGAESVGEAGEEPELGVHRLDESVGQAMGDAVDDAVAVFGDPVVEHDEGGDLASSCSAQPGVEHGCRLVTAVLEHESELLWSVP